MVSSVISAVLSCNLKRAMPSRILAQDSPHYCCCTATICTGLAESSKPSRPLFDQDEARSKNIGVALSPHNWARGWKGATLSALTGQCATNTKSIGLRL